LNEIKEVMAEKITQVITRLRPKPQPMIGNAQTSRNFERMQTQFKDGRALAKAEEGYALTTPSHTENLELIRNFISDIAEKAGLNEMAAMEIEVAVGEACVNAIKHAHQNDEAKPLRLQVKIDKQKLTVLVRDQGQGFDPKKLDGQNAQDVLTKPQNGGRGILMMKMLMDEVHFEANGKGTQVRLVKYLTSPQQESIH
jgi:serine/threonine-protein kinase RsbW